MLGMVPLSWFPWNIMYLSFDRPLIELGMEPLKLLSCKNKSRIEFRSLKMLGMVPLSWLWAKFNDLAEQKS